MNEEQPLENPKFTDLTPEQEQAIVDFWNLTPNNPPSLTDICQHLFGEIYDGRALQMRAIKKSLSKRNLKTSRGSEYKAPELVLTEEHKLFITNHASTMNAWEIAKELFNNAIMERTSKEVRAVNEFIRTLDTTVVMNGGKDALDTPTEDYKPPKRPENALARINEYVNLNLDIKKITPTQRKGIEQLIVYLHTFRFIKQMNTFLSEGDRKSCEDAFIRYTWDKPDLSQEEIDQYIMLASEVVNNNNIQKTIQMMEAEQERTVSEGGKMSMTLVEAVNYARKELNESVNRTNKLFANLTEKRSTKLEKQIKDNASILNLVELWKNEESRKDLIALGVKERESLKGEIERLQSMDDIKARILGLTLGEAVY